MVDLMMWLAIVALLLAAAIQGIGYYQKAAILYQMQSDADHAGTASMKVMTDSGVLDVNTVQRGVTESEWSTDVDYLVEPAPDSKSMPYIRTTHPTIADKDVLYIFEECADYKIGVNVVPKGFIPSMNVCSGVGATVPPVTFAWDSQSPVFDPLVQYGWSDIASSSTGQHLVATKSTSSTNISNTSFFLSHDYGSTWEQKIVDGTPARAYQNASISDDGNIIIVYGGRPPAISNDGGNTWRVISEVFYMNTGSGTAMTGDGRVIVLSNGMQSGQYAHPLQISKDYGATWQASSSPIGKYNKVAISTDGNTIVAGGVTGWVTNENASTDVVVSRDGGATWQVKNPVPSSKWASVTMDDTGSRIVVSRIAEATNVGQPTVFISRDGGESWMDFGGEVTSSSANMICNIPEYAPNGSVAAMACGDRYKTASSIYATWDDGATWKNVSPPWNPPYNNWKAITFSQSGSQMSLVSWHSKDPIISHLK